MANHTRERNMEEQRRINDLHYRIKKLNLISFFNISLPGNRHLIMNNLGNTFWFETLDKLEIWIRVREKRNDTRT